MWSTFLINYIIALQIQGYLTKDSIRIVNEPCTLSNEGKGECVNECFDPEYKYKIDVNEHECSQFGKYCCKSLVQKEDVLTSPNRTKLEKLCARTYRKYGDTIPPNVEIYFDPRLEQPHMAALGYGTKSNITYACSGSLITDKYLLTAAHCIKNKNLGDVKYVRMGDFNVNDNDNEFTQDFKVLRSIIHPDYKKSLGYHDIAIIELDHVINETEYVKPACLPNGKDMVQYNWNVVGWGAISGDKIPTTELKPLYVHNVDINKCKKFFDGNKMFNVGIVDDWQICAQDLNNNTCQGDTGGPLQISLMSHEFSYLRGNTIEGIASPAKVCGITKTLGIYTRVSNYLKWINSIILL